MSVHREPEISASMRHAFTPQSDAPPHMVRASRSSSTSSSVAAVQTYAIPFGCGVDIVRNPVKSRSFDDIILVAVRVTDRSRERDESPVDALPERYYQPPAWVHLVEQYANLSCSRPRSFLRWISTRLSFFDSDTDTGVVRMPRRDYLHHHVRDAAGAYAGSEPERRWDDGTLEVAYGGYDTTSISGVN